MLLTNTMPHRPAFAGHVENRCQHRRMTLTSHMLHISPDTHIFSSAARAGGDRKAKIGELACTWWRAIDTRRSSDAEPLHGTGHEVVDRRRAALRFSVAGRGRLRRTEHCTGDEEAHPVSSGMRGASERALAAGRLPDCSGPPGSFGDLLKWVSMKVSVRVSYKVLQTLKRAVTRLPAR